METSKRFSFGILLLAFLLLLFPELSYANPQLAAWVGVWTLENGPDRSSTQSSEAAVEIRPTAEGKGIEISRKVLDPDSQDEKEIIEVFILDGSRQSINVKNCSGWQSSKWIPETGAIMDSSEVQCKDSGSFRTSNLKVMLTANRMVDILGIIADDQTRIATRYLNFDRDLQSSNESYPELAGLAARMAASGPWNLDGIIQLSKIVDHQVLQAALVEKDVQIPINANSLKKMKSAKLSNGTIDLLVALAFPDEFFVQTNGQVKVTLEPLSSSGSGSSRTSYYPAAGYYPSIYSYLSNRWLYYGSPLWWNSYMLFTPRSYSQVILSERSILGGIPTLSYGQMTDHGYVSIIPIESGRHAMPRGGNHTPSVSNPRGNTSRAPASGGSSGTVSSGGSSSSSGSSSSGSSSSSSSSSGSSSSGSSSGGSSSSGSGGSGRHAVPR